MALCIVISGIFSSYAFHGYSATNSCEYNLIQPVSQASINHPPSDPKINAKNKAKRNILTVTARCSCDLYADYKIHDPEWVNYCPECHRYGTLVFEKTSDCPEGMIRCTCCDADFCAVHGREHVYSHPTYLIPA